MTFYTFSFSRPSTPRSRPIYLELGVRNDHRGFALKMYDSWVAVGEASYIIQRNLSVLLYTAIWDKSAQNTPFNCVWRCVNVNVSRRNGTNNGRLCVFCQAFFFDHAPWMSPQKNSPTLGHMCWHKPNGHPKFGGLSATTVQLHGTPGGFTTKYCDLSENIFRIKRAVKCHFKDRSDPYIPRWWRPPTVKSKVRSEPKFSVFILQ